MIFFSETKVENKNQRLRNSRKKQCVCPTCDIRKLKTLHRKKQRSIPLGEGAGRLFFLVECS